MTLLGKGKCVAFESKLNRTKRIISGTNRNKPGPVLVCESS
jgi:hypothetical protein